MSVATDRFSQCATIEATHGDCPNCQSDLQIHQPDPGLPNRLLAVCEECHHWYLQASDGALIPLVSSEADLASESESVAKQRPPVTRLAVNSPLLRAATRLGKTRR